MDIYSLSRIEKNLERGIFLVIIYRIIPKDILHKTAKLDSILIVDGKIYDPLFNAGDFALAGSIYEMIHFATVYKITSTKYG